jgi:hypothetical protein
MKVVMGPALCKGCGQNVYWARAWTRHLGNVVERLAWRDADGRLHRCGEVRGA